MGHSNRLVPTSILMMTMPFTPFAMGTNTPSHQETYMDSEQFKIEIAAINQQLTSAVEHFYKTLEQRREANMLATTKRFERYHARQLEMSQDIKEILRREGL